MPNENTINILCNIDSNYVPYCGIMLTSLFENNKQSCFKVYIIGFQLSAEGVTSLENIVKKYDNDICFLESPYHDTSAFPNLGGHISIATYLRLFLSQLLPVDVKKILFLDCDLLVLGDITGLWNFELGEAVWAGVADNKPSIATYDRLHIPHQYYYLNAGVLLFDVDKLREMDFTDKALHYISEHADRIVMHDQDVLNALLFDKSKVLPMKYNMLGGFYKHKFPDCYNTQFDEVKSTPTIRHFAGWVKPWHCLYANKYSEKYNFYRDMTEWKGSKYSVARLYKALPFSKFIKIVLGIYRVKSLFGLY